jgi:arsenate reductase
MKPKEIARMDKEKVLFVCVYNSARSQMAEAWMNHLCGDHFAAESAGLEPGFLNPLAIIAMKEAGIDLSGKATRSVFDVYKSGEIFSYVITVCDESAAEGCPIFPGPAKRLHWSFTDPSTLRGTEQEKLIVIREIRDAIRKAVDKFCVSK